MAARMIRLHGVARQTVAVRSALAKPRAAYSTGKGKAAPPPPPAAAPVAAAAAGGKKLYQGKNMQTELLEGGIAVMTMDMAGSPVNKLSLELFPEFDAAMLELETNPEIRAAVIISGKPKDFVVGADINMFVQAQSEDEMFEISKGGQDMFDRLERSSKPVVAAINGSCLGGGLELALACTYRVASSSSRTKLGLPEVMLGVLPAAGGTQRLPKLIGLPAALPLILQGSTVNASKAKKLKMVDAVSDPNALKHSAVQAARELADGKIKVERGPKSYMQQAMKYVLEDTEFGRNQVFSRARGSVMKLTGGVYPAPLKIIDVIEESAKKGFGSKAGFMAEAKGFAQLGMTPESRALVSLFFGKTKCEKNPFKPQNVKTIGVLGAGLMGAGITEVSITKDYKVVLQDATDDGLGNGLARIDGNLSKKVKRRKMTSFAKESTISNIVAVTPDMPMAAKHMGKADLIIEAIFENMELKHKVIAQMEAITKPTCIFASNTSALPITKLAEKSKRPENIVGMHYFSPVEKMMLMEIIRGEKTSDRAVAVAYEVGLKQGKIPIVVKDVPGFYVNRCLGPFSDEGMALLLDGGKIPVINDSIKKYGFPVGPMTLVDEVGIDVAASVGKTLKPDLGVRVGAADPKLLDEVVELGWLGRKAGKGMFLYEKPGGKALNQVNPEMEERVERLRAGRPDKLITPEDIQYRMVLRFVNEAALCLQDEIIADPVVADIGAVFGIGFPPFRGGPFRYIDAMGVTALVEKMKFYEGELGERFSPAPILVDCAKDNKKFHA